MLDDLKMFARFVWGFGRFLRRPLSPEECRQRIAQQLQSREETFIRIVEEGIFGHLSSPYRKLLQHAGFDFPAVVRLVREEGLEGALLRLYEAGVYVTLDEVKGRRPLERSGLSLIVRPQDFDNPLLTKHYEGQTGGSRSAGNRVIIDFDLVTHEAAYHSLFLTAFQAADRPMGVWFPIPPGAAGMKNVLRHVKLGKPVERWFTQNTFSFSPQTCKSFLFTSYAVYSSRLSGRPLPVPAYVPLESASHVARWLAQKTKEATPAVLITYPSSGVRVCLAANELGVDIAGTLFWFGGEPYTPAKAQIVAGAGCTATSRYNMAEIGQIGIPCAIPVALDDVHLASDKLAVIQRDKWVGDSGLGVGALFYTTLLPSCPKIMLNVESDDYGILEDRLCGCPVGELGFSQHLHTIRSYEKLTSEGMQFLGSELLRLVEEVLPAKFGGHPTDYQFVEEEEGGLPKVSIFVSPRVGHINGTEVVETVLKVLQSYPGSKKMMADHWRDGQTLRVVRRAPHATGTARILPLHILRHT